MDINRKGLIKIIAEQTAYIMELNECIESADRAFEKIGNESFKKVKR